MDDLVPPLENTGLRKRDLKWRAYQFSIAIIKFVDRINVNRVHMSLIDQLIRASTSIGANLVEAKAASSKRDFAKFYEIALKSANETKYWLCLLRDGLNVSSNDISPLLSEAKELSNMIAASLLTMRNKR